MGYIKYRLRRVNEPGVDLAPETLVPGEAVFVVGVSLQGSSRVVANNPETRTLAIHIKGGTVWISGFNPKQYCSPEIRVIDYEGNDILSWEMSRGWQKGGTPRSE